MLGAPELQEAKKLQAAGCGGVPPNLQVLHGRVAVAWQASVSLILIFLYGRNSAISWHQSPRLGVLPGSAP